VSTLRVVRPSCSRFSNQIVAHHEHGVTKVPPARRFAHIEIASENDEFPEVFPYLIIRAR